MSEEFDSEPMKTYKPQNFWNRILEKTGIREKEQVLTKVYNQYNYYQGEQPEISFKDCIYYFERTPQLQHPVYGYVDLIFGTDLQVNADDERAKTILEEWNQRTGFFNKLREVGTTTLICGAGLLEKVGNLDMVEPVDMQTIVGKDRDEVGMTKSYKHQTQSGQVIDLPVDRFIEFDLTSYSKTPWGRSLFYSLIVSRGLSNGRVMKPLIEILWSMEESMDGIMRNHASPITFVTYPNATKDFLESKAKELKKREPGSWWLGDRRPELDIFEASSQSKFERYIEHIEKTFELGTQFPHDIMTGDFTSRASSETTESILDKKTRGFQKQIINKVMTEIYEPILLDNGIDPKKANISLSFETSNIIDLDINNMITLYDKKAISVDELREWIKDRAGVDLFNDAKIIQQLALQDVKGAFKKEDEDPEEVELRKEVYRKLKDQLDKPRKKKRKHG